MPKISVIIPIYNMEKYLGTCLDSILVQSLKDIEVLCMNDGSVDKTKNILENYALKDDRIKVINQENMGVAKTRNKAIKLAKGEFVVFIDPDDYYPSNDILETLYQKAKENDVLICGGRFSEFKNYGDVLKTDFAGSVDGYIFNEDKIIDYKDYQFDYGFTRFIYDRKMLIDNKIFFPIYKRFEDPVFFVNVMIKAGKFYAIDKITYAYRFGYKKDNIDFKYVNDFLSGVVQNYKNAKKYNLEKLMEYCNMRFFEHHWAIKDKYNKDSIKNLKTIMRITNDIEVKKNVKQILRVIDEKYSCGFFIRNSVDGKHKIINLLGLKIKFKRKKNG